MACHTVVRTILVVDDVSSKGEDSPRGPPLEIAQTSKLSRDQKRRGDQGFSFVVMLQSTYPCMQCCSVVSIDVYRSRSEVTQRGVIKRDQRAHVGATIIAACPMMQEKEEAHRVIGRIMPGRVRGLL